MGNIMKKILFMSSILCLCILSFTILVQESHASSAQKNYEATQDVSLQRPSAGEGVKITSKAGDRYVFDFDISDATLERKGKSFLLSFTDGGSIELVDFYTVFNKDYMPNFVVNGDMVFHGREFFGFLPEGLMP